MTTTFADLVSLSASVTATTSVGYSTALRANVTAHGLVGGYGDGVVTLGYTSGGVGYQEFYGNVTASTSVTATLGVLRNLQANVTATASARVGDGAVYSLPALEALSADHIYGEASYSLPALETTATGPLPVPSYASAAFTLPALRTVSTALTGTVGEATIVLGPLASLSSNRSYGEASYSLPMLLSRADDEQTAFGIVMRNYIFQLVSLEANLDMLTSMTDGIETTDDIVVQRTMSAILAAMTTLTASQSVSGEFSGRMAEVMQLLDGLVREDVQLVWVYNTVNSANSVYTGWNFNSAVVWQGRPFAASSTGLYELTGNDDDGVPIVASVLTGKADLGIVQQKRMAYVYVGATADTGMDLIVYTDDGQINTYTISARELLTNTRTAIGKGLKSKYWQFELTNPDGSAFEIESMELVPDTLQRRI